MACEAFINNRPQTATRRIIDQANAIIAQYLDQGLKLTLRQLFYQFVARALIENYLPQLQATLAALPRRVYESRRTEAAAQLKMRVGRLDNEVKAEQEKARKTAKKSEGHNAEKLQASATHIINHNDILELFAQDFAKVIAGEAVNGKLLYLVGTSRLFAKPMNAAINGTSSGGKSEIRKRVLEFFPPASQ